ncbi:MAG: hypoxanthine phosphoribosyltransferase [Clostridiales bacterium]|jgi:hypoxanthine phosphoribosyltransferase|nr:hypoxanthine phosphoribosyltransferase [Clostridiales bacterium]
MVSARTAAPPGFTRLYGRRAIETRVDALAKRISADYGAAADVVCVCALKGAALFFARLVGGLALPRLTLDFVMPQSYRGTERAGGVRLAWDVSRPVAGRHVLIAEDIVDSGYTAAFLRQHFREKGAASVRLAALLDKPGARLTPETPEYAAFTLKRNDFVVGFGLDLDQKYRQLPALYRLEAGGADDGT